MNDYSKLNKVSLEIRNQVEEREHFHQDIELIYVLDGAMTVEVGNQKSELKAEDILVINANKKHWLRTNDKDILYLRLGIAYQLVSDPVASCIISGHIGKSIKIQIILYNICSFKTGIVHIIPIRNRQIPFRNI